jgi:hypothetical protein
LVAPTAPYDSSDCVAVADSIRDALQDEYSKAFATTVAIATMIEAIAFAVF